MGFTLSTRQVGWTLVALTMAAVALTATMVVSSGHAMDPSHYAPAIILVIITGSWPFVNGWRPGGARMRTCGTCGTQWRPNSEGGAMRCPACSIGAQAESA